LLDWFFVHGLRGYGAAEPLAMYPPCLDAQATTVSRARLAAHAHALIGASSLLQLAAMPLAIVHSGPGSGRRWPRPPPLQVEQSPSRVRLVGIPINLQLRLCRRTEGCRQRGVRTGPTGEAGGAPEQSARQPQAARSAGCRFASQVVREKGGQSSRRAD
ncbi:MAG: hypothetical protein ACLQU3_32965, partial [Limisphaerales bacterium]